MDNKLSELKAAAMAATPGPWSWKTDGNFCYLSPEGVNTPLERIIDDGSAWGEYGETIEHDSPDARFIAAANPATVLALLAELEAKDKRIAELERITEGVDQLAIDGGWTARGMSEYAKSLERRLTTPVRLPTTSGRVGVAYTRVIPEVIEAVRAAGFTVEGDE